MRDEIVAYIETRIQELLAIADKAKMNGDINAAKSAIQSAIELNTVEIEVNNIELRKIENMIEEIEKRRESA